MRYVYILQCGIDVVFCSSAIKAAHQALNNRLTPDQANILISYMSLTRLFNRDHIYELAIPHGITWVIKKLAVQKKAVIE